METITKNTYDRIREIDRKELDNLIELISDFGNDVNHAITQRGFYISDWFRAYLLSPEFQKIERDRQLEIFEHFENIKFLLEELNSFNSKHGIGAYEG